MAVKRYSSYKPSGALWASDIPAHWRSERLKEHADNINAPAKGKDHSSSYIALEHVESWTGKITPDGNGTNFESQAKQFEPGDVLFGKLRPYLAKVARPDQAGVCVSEFLVLRADTSNLLPTYLEVLLRSKQVIDTIDASTFGAKMPRADWQFIGNLRQPLPPLDEQTAIVRFLDHADEQIQRYIAGKERLIALLEEERQALVHQAVTRGLDPNVRLKPSGMEWLGDVPEQWDISRVKNEFYSLNHQRIPLSATERRTMSIRHYDYYGASGVIDKVEGYLFKDELLLIAEDGANLVLRNLPLAIIARGKFWVNNHAHILKPRRGNLEFLAGLLEGIDYKPWISGAAQPKLTQDRLMSIAIAVPPKEQQDSDHGPYLERDSVHSNGYQPLPPPDSTDGGIPHPVDCRRGHRENRRARSQTVNETQTPDSSNSTPNTPAPEPRPSGAGSNTGIVYVLENPAMPGYIKLGRTENLTQRMQSLFDTSVPVPFTYYYAARVEDPARVERSLFEAFGDKRSHPRREFFTVDPHRAAAVIKLVEVEDVTNQVEIDTSTGNEDTVSVNRATARTERLNFEMLDIQVGEILEFVKDPEITCRVVNQKPARVEYEGEIMSLSVAAQKAMNSNWGLQGSQYWMYGGRTLQEIREQMEARESD